jgi:plasmid stabilization system protein ParE
MEQYRVKLSIKAYRDLRNASNYIATQYLAPIAAAKKVKRLKETIQNKLSFMPQKYRLVNDNYLASIGYRMMNVENYIAFFSIDANKKVVWVERIIHSKRDWKRLLPEET